MKPKWYLVLMRSDMHGEGIQQDLAVEAEDEESARSLTLQLVKKGWEIINVEPLMSTEGVYAE